MPPTSDRRAGGGNPAAASPPSGGSSAVTPTGPANDQRAVAGSPPAASPSNGNPPAGPAPVPPPAVDRPTAASPADDRLGAAPARPAGAASPADDRLGAAGAASPADDRIAGATDPAPALPPAGDAADGHPDHRCDVTRRGAESADGHPPGGVADRRRPHGDPRPRDDTGPARPGGRRPSRSRPIPRPRRPVADRDSVGAGRRSDGRPPAPTPPPDDVDSPPTTSRRRRYPAGRRRGRRVLALLYGGDLLLSQGSVPRGVTVAGVSVGGLALAAAEQTAPRGDRAPHHASRAGAPRRRRDQHVEPAAAGLAVDWPATMAAAGEQPLDPDHAADVAVQHPRGRRRHRSRPRALEAALTELKPAFDKPAIEGNVRFDGITPQPVEPVAGRQLDVPDGAAVLTRDWMSGAPVALPLTRMNPPPRSRTSPRPSRRSPRPPCPHRSRSPVRTTPATPSRRSRSPPL